MVPPNPGVAGLACLPETPTLIPGAAASPEACIAACGATLAPNNRSYYANLYGTGNDTCGEFCTCASTCHETRMVAGQTYPVCFGSDVFQVKTSTNKQRTSTVHRGGVVRYTLRLRQNKNLNLDTLAAGLGVRLLLTPTAGVSKLRSRVTPKPMGYTKHTGSDVANDGNSTVIAWRALGLFAKKTYTFSATFRVPKAAVAGSQVHVQAELFQAGIADVPPYCVRVLGSQTLVRNYVL